MKIEVGALSLLAVAVVVGSCGGAGRPCESRVTKGPWVLRVDETRATVLWESDDEGCVEAGVRAEGTALGSTSVERIVEGSASSATLTSEWGTAAGIMPPDRPGIAWLNTVAIEGLSPSTCYLARVRAAGSETQKAGIQEARFCTARSAGEDISFLAVGDTNPLLGHTIPVLKHVLADKPDFSLHLGDMQYYSALRETWGLWFQMMTPMLRAGAMFATNGNHESEIPGEQEDYYDRLFADASVEHTGEHWYRFSSGGVWFFSMDSEQPMDSDDAPQVLWLKQALADARMQPGFRFSVVYMHRPLITTGDSNPRLEERAVLEPIFVANDVELVLVGHMHGYERFETPVGITYLTCGAGGGIINKPEENAPNFPELLALRKAFSNHYSACLLRVEGNTLSLKVVDELGATVDEMQRSVP